MKQEFKIFTLATFVLIVSCGIMLLQADAQEAEGQQAERDDAMRIQQQNLRESNADIETMRRLERLAQAERIPDQVQGSVQRQRQLRQIDAEIERLRQMVQEAEKIRENIARQSGQLQAQAPQQRAQAAPLSQSNTAVRRGTPGQQPLISRPKVQAVIDNLPQIIDQLGNALNNNIDRMHNAYQRIQQRLTNLEQNNQRLQNENQDLRNQNKDLRNQNQNLRARLKEIEPRRPAARESDTVEQP